MITEHVHSITTGGAAPVATSLPTIDGAAARGHAVAVARRVPWPDLFGLAGVLLVTALLAWHRLWLENGLGYLDISTFYMPWYAHLGESIRALDIPGWNPYQFSGTPFAGDPQSGWWYFPAMVFFTIFDPVRAYEAYIVFHMAFAGICCYLLGRRYGFGVLPSLAAGVIYQSGPFVSHISCCLIHIQLGAWMPAALLSVEQVVRSRDFRSRALGWVATGFCMSQMMAGWPGQGMYNGILVTGGYLAWRLVMTRQNGALDWRDRLIRLASDSAGVLSMALLWGAAGLLPRMDIISRTNVAWGQYEGYETDKYSAGWSFRQLIDYLWTDNNGYQSLLFYIGAPVIVLAFAGAVLAWHKSWARFFVALTVLTSILTLHRTPVHELLFAILPRFEELHSHVPSRILAVQWLGPTMLAAAAIHELMQAPSRRSVVRAAIVGLLGWTIGAGIVTSAGWPISPLTVSCAVLTVGVVLLFTTVNTPPADRTGRFVPRAQALLAGLLILLILTDPAGGRLITTLRTGQTMSEVIRIPTGPVPREVAALNDATTDPDGAGEFLQSIIDSGDYVRFFGYDDVLQEGGDGYLTTYREYFADPTALAILVNARAMRLHISDVQGYNPVQLKNYVLYLTDLNGEVQNYHDAQILPGGITSPLLDILNAKYIIIPNSAVTGRPRADVMTLLATYPEVFSNDDVRVLMNPDAMPRAWIVHDVVEAGSEETAAMLESESFDPATTVILPDGSDAVVTTQPAAGANDSATITNYENDAIDLTVHAASDGMLVLSETFEQGWHATVDGEKVPVVEAYGVARAIPIPAGDHTVALTYDPWSLRIGFYLSLMGAAISLIVVAAFVIDRIRRTRRPEFAERGI